MNSGNIQVSWPKDQPFARLRIQISAPDCEIHSNDTQSFRLYLGQDSPVFYFHLIAKKLGKISIIVKIYQKTDWLGSTRIHTMAYEQEVGSIQLEVSSKKIKPPVIFDKDNDIMLTLEQQAAWQILQQAFSLVANELKQRWQLAREKEKPSGTTQNEEIQPNVSESLQNTIKSELENMQDTTKLKMMTDNLDTAIKMAERYNHRRNKYRQQLPLAVDPVPIEIQIEEAESERDKAIAEMKSIFEEIAKQEVIINEAP